MKTNLAGVDVRAIRVRSTAFIAVVVQENLQVNVILFSNGVAALSSLNHVGLLAVIPFVSQTDLLKIKYLLECHSKTNENDFHLSRTEIGASSIDGLVLADNLTTAFQCMSNIAQI